MAKSINILFDITGSLSILLRVLPTTENDLKDVIRSCVFKSKHNFCSSDDSKF